jgi:hypothetical protein
MIVGETLRLLTKTTAAYTAAEVQTIYTDPRESFQAMNDRFAVQADGGPSLFTPHDAD